MTENGDVAAFCKAAQKITPDVRMDHVVCDLYSVDASIYEVAPLAVAVPRSRKELVEIVRLATSHRLPVIARGAATGITGGCLGRGVIIDLARYCHKIIDIDQAAQTARVQPGVVQDRLNEKVAPFGLRLGPDTSTGNRATIGGMIANNAAGQHSLKYGKMQDHIVSADLLLSTGEEITLSPKTEEEWRALCQKTDRTGGIYREIDRLQHDFGGDIARDFPKVRRRASGYSLDALLNGHNLAPILAGSEGTLGIITEVTLKLSPVLKEPYLIVAAVQDVMRALKAVPELLEHAPISLEMIDHHIIERGRLSPLLHGTLDWLTGDPQALFLIEFEAPSQATLQAIQNRPEFLWTRVFAEGKESHSVWELRKAGLGLLLSERSWRRAIAFIEDVTVPPEQVAPFVQKLSTLLGSLHIDYGLYGHIGEGCLHIRPYICLQSVSDLVRMQTIVQQVMGYVRSYGGVLSGEHGDGLVRSWTNPLFFSKPIYQAFLALKRAFDPIGLMNPGKVVSPQGHPLDNLRLSPQSTIKDIPHFYDYAREGGFPLAVDLCNGNGQCRKREGVMCPSFQVTQDERQSTRARAQLFRSIVHGHLPLDALAGEEAYQVMDCCIQCKGCKKECPSQVDMAKIKSEYLFYYGKTRGHPLRSYLFGYLGTLFSVGAVAPSLCNWLSGTRLAKACLNAMGITTKHALPRLAHRRFSSLPRPHSTPRARRVALFVDTFTEFLSPEIGYAAVSVFKKLGFAVTILPWHCCGRTLISKGFLPEARKKAIRLLELLYPYAKAGIPIVGLEPSCTLTMRDEWGAFSLDTAKVAAVQKQVFTIDEFLLPLLGEIGPRVRPMHAPILFHGHCHQKALVGTEGERTILQALTTASASEIRSGCCGMAGSFGYEKEHMAMSRAIGELALFPAITKMAPKTLLVASGTSCRSQILDHTARKAVHLIQLVDACL